MNATVVFVPGLRGHVEEHWQTHAARDLPGSLTVAAPDVNPQSRAGRVAALDAAIRSAPGDVILAAHSAGCLTVAHWAAQSSSAVTRVRGALLVTPADIETPLPEGYPTPDTLAENGWLPIPLARLPFPTTVVASRNDPLAEYERVAHLAANWGGALHDAGEVGHLNPAAGFGPWPEALGLIAGLTREQPDRLTA